MENDIFPCLVQERRREIENGRKIFPPSPHFFIHPIWEENGEEKVLNDILYINILILFLSPVNDYYYFFFHYFQRSSIFTQHIYNITKQ